MSTPTSSRHGMAPRYADEGPRISYFLVATATASSVDQTWDPLGMRATASNGFTLDITVDSECVDRWSRECRCCWPTSCRSGSSRPTPRCTSAWLGRPWPRRSRYIDAAQVLEPRTPAGRAHEPGRVRVVASGRTRGRARRRRRVWSCEEAGSPGRRRGRVTRDEPRDLPCKAARGGRGDGGGGQPSPRRAGSARCTRGAVLERLLPRRPQRGRHAAAPAMSPPTSSAPPHSASIPGRHWERDRGDRLDQVHRHGVPTGARPAGARGTGSSPRTTTTAGLARRIWQNAGVDRRHVAVDPRVEDLSDGAPAQRMRRFVQRPCRSARRQCRRASSVPDSAPVTSTSSPSCRAPATPRPGIDILLARDLDMRADLQRTHVGHMGCYAALAALGSVTDAAVARGKRGVLLCLELTSLHIQPPTRRPPATRRPTPCSPTRRQPSPSCPMDPGSRCWTSCRAPTRQRRTT